MISFSIEFSPDNGVNESGLPRLLSPITLDSKFSECSMCVTEDMFLN